MSVDCLYGLDLNGTKAKHRLLTNLVSTIVALQILAPPTLEAVILGFRNERI